MDRYGSIPLETLREIACNRIVQLRTEEARAFSNQVHPSLVNSHSWSVNSSALLTNHTPGMKEPRISSCKELLSGDLCGKPRRWEYSACHSYLPPNTWSQGIYI